ncbi:hypothetical protein DFH09DRAFT_1077637 [Mycena vulgaris]|nr:hypothetical protein DFH09DRAFT_1077637 [Mycena vulgaris]
MPDTTSKLQIFVFTAISLVPGTTMRYIGLGLATASLAVAEVDRLENSIKITEKILEGAKMDCTRDQVELMPRGNRLRQTKILASKIQTRVQEAEDTPRGIMQSIDKCRLEVKEIQSSTLLTIEAERQRKLSEGIKESREVISVVLRAPTRHAHFPSRRSELKTDEFFQESYM